MNLVKADTAKLEATVGFDLAERGHSAVEPIEAPADMAAALWLKSMDIAFRRRVGASMPPVWLYEKFKWGPHRWPVQWRDITRMPYHDCGLMAALSTEIYRLRGYRVMPAQLVLHFNSQSTRGWTGLWRSAGLTPHWCDGEFAYHEGTAVVDKDNELHIWDALGRFWLPIRESLSYEGIVAFRLISDPAVEIPLPTMKSCQVTPDHWYSVRDFRKDFEMAA